MLQSASLHPAGFLRREHERQIDRLPRRFVPAVHQKWMRLYREHGSLAPANEMLRGVFDAVDGFRFGVAASDDDLRAFARARADECWRIAARLKLPEMALRYMLEVAQRYGIPAPSGRNVTPEGQRARLLCEKWWRRQVRKVAGRNVEAAAIKVGLVHRYAGLYASDETVAQRRGQKARNRALLEAITAINDEGQEYTLQALSDLGTSNPKIRRDELMVRLAGFDEIAVKLGHAAEFYTLTAPSKFHARDSITGKENKTYAGATPNETQAYLCQVWARVRAALHRRGVRLYGVRVCEPHHDGCPHWHMVLFMDTRWPRKLCGPLPRGHKGPAFVYDEKAAAVPRVRAIMRRYALAVDGNERGARLHRFKAEAIDRSKGGAADYLAKYIGKNIDGYGVGEDWEAVAGRDDAATSAQRVDAWASRWGIRQFQQIGGAPVTVWRELRRMEADSVTDALLAEIIRAADLGGKYQENATEKLNGWARYVQLMGGPFAKRQDMPARVWRQGPINEATGEVIYPAEPMLNAYGEPAAPKTRGIVTDAGEEYATRTRVWVFERRGAAVPPWSSVNNCTRGGFAIAAAYRVQPWKSEQEGAKSGGEDDGEGGSLAFRGGGGAKQPRRGDGAGQGARNGGPAFAVGAGNGATH